MFCLCSWLGRCGSRLPYFQRNPWRYSSNLCVVGIASQQVRFYFCFQFVPSVCIIELVFYPSISGCRHPSVGYHSYWSLEEWCCSGTMGAMTWHSYASRKVSWKKHCTPNSQLSGCLIKHGPLLLYIWSLKIISISWLSQIYYIIFTSLITRTPSFHHITPSFQPLCSPTLELPTQILLLL